VPATFFSLAEFDRAKGGPVKWWRLRTAPVNQSDGRRRLSVEELVRYLQNYHQVDDCVIQEYIEPALSGVAYFVGRSVIIEAVIGECEALLRGGIEGELWRVDVRDAANRKPTVDHVADLAEDRHGISYRVSLLSELCDGQLPSGWLIEWIIDPDGRFLVVDLKEVGDHLVSWIEAENLLWVGRPQDGSASLVVETPKFAHVDLLTDWQGTYVRCLSGSPLAHFCVEAHGLGISVKVLRRHRMRSGDPR
jgi:hypothetical protein